MLRQSATAAVLLLLWVAPLTAGDQAAGEIVFKKKCFACHAVGEGARNKVGPILNGLFGRTAGSIQGYNYSKANKESGIVWDVEIFTTYIRNPRALVPGTKMTFAGIKNDQEIADLIAYLSRFAPDGTTVK